MNILTQFQKTTLNQIMKAHLTASDKIENLKELLRPYNLEDQLSAYYTPQSLFDNFSSDSNYASQLKPLKKFLHPSFLASKHYYIVDNVSHQITPVTMRDVKNAEKRVIRLLEYSANA